MTNAKSDVAAQTAFAEELKRRGFSDVRITKQPADITARMGSDNYYFEVKFTSAEKDYWGAATLTEWEAALAHNAIPIRSRVSTKRSMGIL